MRLAEHLPPELVLVAPEVEGRQELLRLFARRLVTAGLAVDAADIARRLEDRERILSTGIGGGVAIPHAQVPGLGRMVMAASIHPSGIDYPSLDGTPVKLVLCLVGDASTSADHLAGLARLARLARKPDVLAKLVAAATPEAFIAVLAGFESASG